MLNDHFMTFIRSWLFKLCRHNPILFWYIDISFSNGHKWQIFFMNNFWINTPTFNWHDWWWLCEFCSVRKRENKKQFGFWKHLYLIVQFKALKRNFCLSGQQRYEGRFVIVNLHDLGHRLPDLVFAGFLVQCLE